jgi:mono/diheme cytochrome c family protein
MMRRILWFVAGLVAGIVAVLGIPALVVQFGGFSMSALGGPRGPEQMVGSWLLDRWVATHAEDLENPLAESPAAIAAGREHYTGVCVLCHGAPGVKPSEFGQGLNPPAPDLWGDTQDMNDGQLFLVIKDGVRMTGMPSFGTAEEDEHIWQVVAFVRHLPRITPQERSSLRAAIEQRHH